MSITQKDVEYVANLARLELTGEEKERLARQLGDILDYINMLNRLDTTNVEPMAHAAIEHNVFREDGEPRSITPDETLANAPDRQGDFFKVPKVID
ncbi:MAG TPA: Asp-tRNA(Asn)/Glu-tRNA(Gln) amidotransferase subunit GatC [Candidatus Brocadiia bacterium]|nr:Asp-tRNA(Asn)/Glu-tRNA(Gln) amidotransferase subunit GatC [Candidatus Brocadiia bacterium]